MKVLQIDIDQGESGLFYAIAPKSNTGLLVVGDSIGHVLNKIPIAWEELQQVRRQFEERSDERPAARVTPA